MTDTKKRAQIVSAFTDHGTGEQFEAGTTPLIDAGAFANYEAAGLVRTPPAPTKTATAAKPRTRAARKTPSKPKAAAAPAAAPAATDVTDTAASGAAASSE